MGSQVHTEKQSSHTPSSLLFILNVLQLIFTVESVRDVLFDVLLLLNRLYEQIFDGNINFSNVTAFTDPYAIISLDWGVRLIPSHITLKRLGDAHLAFPPSSTGSKPLKCEPGP